MFTHVLDAMGVLRNADSRHPIILEHSLVAEVVLEEKCTDPVHLAVVHLAVVVLLQVLSVDELEVLLPHLLQLAHVLGFDGGSLILNLSEMEVHLFDCVLDLR